jgi:hypothetical protein
VSRQRKELLSSLCVPNDSVYLTTAEGSDGIPHRNTANDAYILKRLKAKDIGRFQGSTDEDELYIRQVMGLIEDGALAETNHKESSDRAKEGSTIRGVRNSEKEIPKEFFQPAIAGSEHHASSPREVILSSFQRQDQTVNNRMQNEQARSLIRETFTKPFEKHLFGFFVRNVLNEIDESKSFHWTRDKVDDAFKSRIRQYERLATYTDPDGEKLDILVIYLQKQSSLERA